MKAPEGHSRGKGQTRPAARPHQYECRGWSGGIAVLVDESVTAGRSNDLEVSIWLGRFPPLAGQVVKAGLVPAV